jgi:hypothetical protein
MSRISGEKVSGPMYGEELPAATKKALLRRRADALCALEEAESTEDPEAAADARKHVQDAQRLILRYGLE